MAPHKRTRSELHQGEETVAGAQNWQDDLLRQIRNMWEFAAVVQYVYTFGSAMKVPEEIDIDLLETECLKPGPSEVLADLALILLKFISSHRGLTTENFDEYTRRQYYSKAPALNPFGDAEQPLQFNEFDTFTKLRVIHQLTAWTLWNPEKFRERMPQQKEVEQLDWRVEEFGYDSKERIYYVLDDNRLYRRTDPPVPESEPAKKPKANSKRGRALARAAKKRKLSETAVEDENETADAAYSGYKWECIAVSLAEYRSFMDSLQKSKDPNEKILRDRLLQFVMPVVEKHDEEQQKKAMRRQKELLNLERLSHAKRSSRIADKMERERHEQELAEEERKREDERLAALELEEQHKQLERERPYRLMTRQQRLKERQEKQRQREAELERMEEESRKLEKGEIRMSERRLKAELEQRRKDMADLRAREYWIFDCSVCGMHGENFDDGSHSIACEKCSVWQHSRCLGFTQEEAEREDFRFICSECKRRLEDEARPKIPPLRFHVRSASGSMSPPLGVNGESKPVPVVSPTKRSPPAQPPAGAPALVSSNSHLPTLSSKGESSSPGQHPTTEPNNSSSPTHNLLSRPSPTPAQAQSHAFVQHQHPLPFPHSPLSAAKTPRPSSSHSAASTLPSPFQNVPALSPTQGNSQVGALAGFPGVGSPGYRLTPAHMNANGHNTNGVWPRSILAPPRWDRAGQETDMASTTNLENVNATTGMNTTATTMDMGMGVSVPDTTGHDGRPPFSPAVTSPAKHMSVPAPVPAAGPGSRMPSVSSSPPTSAPVQVPVSGWDSPGRKGGRIWPMSPETRRQPFLSSSATATANGPPSPQRQSSRPPPSPQRQPLPAPVASPQSKTNNNFSTDNNNSIQEPGSPSHSGPRHGPVSGPERPTTPI